MESLCPRRRSRSRKKKPVAGIGSLVPGRAPVGLLAPELEQVLEDVPVNGHRTVPNNKIDTPAMTSPTTPSMDKNPTSALPDKPQQTMATMECGEEVSQPVCCDGQTTRQQSPYININNPPHAHSTEISPASSLSLDAVVTPAATPPTPALDASEGQEAPPAIPQPADCQTTDTANAQPEASNLPVAQGAKSKGRRKSHSSSSSSSRLSKTPSNSSTRSKNPISDSSDIDNIPSSSKPISLSSFAVRTHNKNKGSKSWVPLCLEDLEEDDNDMDPRNYNNRIARPPARYSVPSVPANNHPLRHVTTMDPVSDFVGIHEVQPHPPQQWPQPMGHTGHMDTFAYYQQIPGVNVPHHGHRPPMMAFTSSVPRGAGPQIMGPEDVSPTKHEEKHAMREFQYSNAGQSTMHGNPYMADPAFDPFNQDQIAYRTAGATEEALYLQNVGADQYSQPQGHTAQNYISPQRPLANENANTRYTAYSSNPSPHSSVPGVITRVAGTKLSPEKKSDCTPTSISSHSPVSMKKASTTPQANANVSPQRPGLNAAYVAKQKEGSSFLRSVGPPSQEKDKVDIRIESIIAAKDAIAKNQYTPVPGNHPLPSRPVPQPDLSMAKSVRTPQAPAEHPLPSRLPQHELSPARSVGTPRVQRTPNTGPEPWDPPAQNTSTSTPLAYTSPHSHTEVDPVFSSAFTERTIPQPIGPPRSQSRFRFPPGLPIPAGLTDTTPVVEKPDMMTSRLVDSTAWFNEDRRGGDELRQKITETAQEVAARQKKNGIAPLRPGERAGVAEAGTILLGHVLANFQSYTLGDSNQDKGFANFGSAPSYCYEPSHGGRRSYFDIDPITDPWKLPPPRHPLARDPLLAYEDGDVGATKEDEQKESAHHASERFDGGDPKN
ncbi:hypothetical protein FQN53_003188 [Emmonsiellopsis sp. PD_33]|nr:hypothetical protein FQN53_003188 [Emmonsiellopsis sp. PD_33]